jgi:aspartyl-tRNA(Asn)/glutamyl-tRNA(Gln) amidotransferase subunit A
VSELTAKTIAELRDGFRSGEFTAREIAEGFSAAVAAAKLLNAYTVETRNGGWRHGGADHHRAERI